MYDINFSCFRRPSVPDDFAKIQSKGILSSGEEDF